MLRSMYSGISGMKSNQVKLDVIGNNISNLGTTGFKSSTVKFQDMLSQSIGDATSPSMNQGGVNSKQVGLGVQLSSIDTVMTQGTLQPTGRSLDIALDGGGFFMVSKGPAVFGDNTLEVSHKAGAHNISSQSIINSGSEMMFSRAGTFTLDEEGNLLTSDGYRVMGYSVTNDDNGMQPTGQIPNGVSAAGLDFRFGPGSQLNGYKVVIGKVGPGTVTDAEVDKGSKIIKIHGDFSKNSTITKEAIESAANKALSAAGISQRLNVSGSPVQFNELGSNTVEGGSDATAPASVSLMGVTFKFSEGSNLNGYTIKVGEIKSNSTDAVLDENAKTITINSNFMDKGAVTGQEIADAINAVLNGKNMSVTAIGNPSIIPGLESKSKNGTDGDVPKAIKNGADEIITFAQSTSPDSTGRFSELNGYKINIDDKANSINIDKSSKVITLSKTDLTDGTKFQDALRNAGFKSIDVTITADKTKIPESGSFTIGNEGKDKKAPDKVNIGGFTIELPKGNDFNDYTFKIVDIEASTLSATPSTADPKVIEISGDFLNGTVTADNLRDALKTLPNLTEIKVSGRAKIDLEAESSMIDGGAELKEPGAQEVFGMTIEFDAGAALNGYRVVIGDTSPSTKTSANVDTKNKTIVINGDFVNGRVAGREIQNVINRSLKDKGIDQGVKILGNPNTIDGTISEETSGGTPVQSLDQNGVVSFVDGAKEVKAYDEGLKTLKIPDKVKDPASGEELAVKSFNIDKNGIINCILENGSVAAVGQIAMANFKNPEGLDKLGGNLYAQSANSGEPTIKSGIGTRGDDNSKGYGDMLQGMIELSNVDLSEQFTDMITTTRAFQASGKIINTGDEILQDIINLKR